MVKAVGWFGGDLCTDPTISPKYPQNIPKIFPKYPQNILKISPKYPQNIPKISPQYLQKKVCWQLAAAENRVL